MQNKIIDRETAERQGDTQTNIKNISNWHVTAAWLAKKDGDSTKATRHLEISNRLDLLATMLN